MKRIKDSLRCANCYALTPKDGNRVMMTCSRCKKVRYCRALGGNCIDAAATTRIVRFRTGSVACQRRDFKVRHRAVCQPPAPKKPAATSGVEKFPERDLDRE